MLTLGLKRYYFKLKVNISIVFSLLQNLYPIFFTKRGIKELVVYSYTEAIYGASGHVS
jgi:hypothetical protein